jgi:hypothetical protein
MRAVLRQENSAVEAGAPAANNNGGQGREASAPASQARSTAKSGAASETASAPLSAATAAAAARGAVESQASAPPGSPLRKVHPKNGNFDVVVVQAPHSRGSGDTDTSLGGAQVYTVYLEVGTSRPWVLQFSKPDAAAEKIRGGVVQLGTTAPIQPPYPVVTLVPPQNSTSPSEKVYVRGFLTAEGRLDGLTLVGETGAASRDVLTLLGQWQFRPAMENGVPVRVQILLTIPPTERS